MRGLEPAAFYAQYSGTWTADAETAQQVRDALGVPAARAGQARPAGGGGRGGFPGTGVRAPGGGMRGGGGGPRGGTGARPEDRDPESMRMAAELSRTIARRLVLVLGPETLTIEGLGPDPVTLVPGGDAVATVTNGTRVEVKAEWDGANLVVKRATDPGEIVDRYEPIGAGDRLLVTRTVGTPAGGDREVAWTYRRDGS